MTSEEINFEVFDRFPNYNFEGTPCPTSRQTESDNSAFTRDCVFPVNIDPRLQGTCSEPEESCTESILHALQLLCVPPSACLSVSDDNLSTQSNRASYRQSRKMDDVLTTNRGVIDLVERVLRCSCSTTPSVQLLIITVCDRLIAWYQAMLREENQQPPYTHETGTQDEQSEHVLPQPITMGDFSVDPAMQLQIREQLVMGELHRVKEAIQLFAARLQQVKNQNTSAQSRKIHDSLSLLLRHHLHAQSRVNSERAMSS